MGDDYFLDTSSPPNHLSFGWKASSRGQDPMSRRGLPDFLQKLWDMLNNPFINSIQWKGINSFEVKNKEEFTKLVLPMHFKHSRYSSFCRQLHTYQFKKIQAIESRWMHKYLLKGHYKSLHNINIVRKSKPRKLNNWQIEAKDLQKTLQNYQVKIVSLKWHIQQLERNIKMGKQCYEAFQRELKEVNDLLKEKVETVESNRRRKSMWEDLTDCSPQYPNQSTFHYNPLEKLGEVSEQR